MSNVVNDQLLDRAAEMCDYWDGTLYAKLIQRALDSNDLEEVAYRVAEAEAEAARIEIYGSEAI